MVNIDNITDAEWRKPSNIAQHKVMRDKINEVITVVNEGGGGGGGGGSVPPELITDVAIEIVFGLPIDCSILPTLYNNDATLVCTPVINAENCTSLREVFRNCSKLTAVGAIHSPNATDMENMFHMM